MASRRDSDALISVACIFTDPLAIWMLPKRPDAGGRKGEPDLGVADDAGRQRDLQIEEIASGSAIQHEAGIGDRRLMLRDGFQPSAGDTPALA